MVAMTSPGSESPRAVPAPAPAPALATGTAASFLSKACLSRPVSALILVWLLSLFLAVGFGSFLVFTRVSVPAVGSYPALDYPDDSSLAAVSAEDQCDVFHGDWVRDFSYPLYNSSGCPFAERGFNCQGNGRKDRAYQTWRWRPSGCELPRFDAPGLLERLRGKRVVFVGDSMSRTQWESLICLLMTAVEDKKSVYEVNGHRITKQIRFLGVRFSSFNFTVEFFRSVFLVQKGRPPNNSPKRVKSALKLDALDDINQRWINSDILIFNSGQWWNQGKLFGTGLYFQVNGSLKLGMPIATGFRTALNTWAAWVEQMVDTNRTRVFFRTFEPSHFSPGPRHTCTVTHYPLKDPEGHDKSELSNIISDVTAKMKVPVTVLHVTPMGAFRSDAHVGRWSDTPSPDCSHWCLPGVPDVWNELIFSHLLRSN